MIPSKDALQLLELDMKQVFRSFAPLDLSFVYQLQDTSAYQTELFFEKRIPQPSPEFDRNRQFCHRSEKRSSCCPIPLKV